MPSRTIEESHRPRVSDRTMHCHSSSGQLSGLLFQKTTGAVTTAKMEPQGRRIDSPFHTRKRTKPFRLGKTTLRVRVHVQTVGLNAEAKNGRHRAEGEIFQDLPQFLRLARDKQREVSGLSFLRSGRGRNPW